MRGVVYYGEQFVEVPDATVTLRDICTSFGLTGEFVGFSLKNRASGLVVATLPFEVLPEVSSASGDVDEMTYDLITPADGDAATEERDPTTDDMTNILKQLVQLGATPLLSAETDALIDPYEPRAAPGLLLRTIYPPSAYCPYRYRGDPVKAVGRFGATSSAATHSASPPYMSAVEVYTVEKATGAALRGRPDLTPKTEEEANDIMRGLLTAATQAKAMIALTSAEERRHAEVDVKPNIYPTAT